MNEQVQPSPRQRRRERRRQEILAAALERFAAGGYDGASMEEIAEAALLSRAGLYKYYPDKAALFAAVQRWKLDELTARARAAVAAANDFEAQLGALVAETLSFQDEHPGFFRLLLTAGSLPELRAAGDGAFAPFAALLTEVIDGGIDGGAVRFGAPSDEIAMLLAGLLLKNTLKRNVLGLEPPADRAADAARVTALFLHGVRGG